MEIWTYQLSREGEQGLGALYLVVSVAGCLAGVWIGQALAAKL